MTRAWWILVLVFAACGGGSTTSKPAIVGESTLTFVDSSRATPANGTYAGAPDRTLVVEIWYPAVSDATNAPAAAAVVKGKHPLIVHSHGLEDTRLGEDYLAQHLAQNGYIVVAPDYPLSNRNAPGGATVLDTAQQPLDLRFVIDQILADATFGPAIDQTKIAASGLSLGGLTTLLAGYDQSLRDPRLKALFTMAAPACMFEPAYYATDLPLFAVHGDVDQIVSFPENGQRLFDRAPAPKHLAVLKNGTHTAFAGLATALSNAKNYDIFGCQALTDVSLSGLSTQLGPASDGISQDANDCPNPCSGAVPPGEVLDAQRQQDLAEAMALAFFDSVLRNSSTAKTFIDVDLVRDNPEVTLQ